MSRVRDPSPTPFRRSRAPRPASADDTVENAGPVTIRAASEGVRLHAKSVNARRPSGARDESALTSLMESRTGFKCLGPVDPFRRSPYSPPSRRLPSLTGTAPVLRETSGASSALPRVRCRAVRGLFRTGDQTDCHANQPSTHQPESGVSASTRKGSRRLNLVLDTTIIASASPDLRQRRAGSHTARPAPPSLSLWTCFSGARFSRHRSRCAHELARRQPRASYRYSGVARRGGRSR